MRLLFGSELDRRVYLGQYMFFERFLNIAGPEIVEHLCYFATTALT